MVCVLEIFELYGVTEAKPREAIEERLSIVPRLARENDQEGQLALYQTAIRVLEERVDLRVRQTLRLRLSCRALDRLSTQLRCAFLYQG